MLTQVKITRIRPNAKLPSRKTPQSAGADLYACFNEAQTSPITINPHETVMIGLGIKTEFDHGYVALIYARSGLSIEKHSAPANKVGVIDADYRGEWKVALHNHSNYAQVIEDGDRIAQVVFQKIETPIFEEVELEDLSETARGEGGFGSTGVK